MSLTKLTRPLVVRMMNTQLGPTSIVATPSNKYHALALDASDDEVDSKARESSHHHGDSIVKGENVILFGAGNIGQNIAHQLFLKGVKVRDHYTKNFRHL